MRPNSDSSKILRTVQISVVELNDIELLQSAEIIIRELKSRGIDVVRDDSSSVPAWRRVLLSHEALRSGHVEVFSGPSQVRVALEDVVDKIMEMSDASKN